MKNGNQKLIIESGGSEERLSLAKIRVTSIWALVLESMKLHATNWHLVHSNFFSGQVKNQRAFETMGLLKRTMVNQELASICKIWDKCDNMLEHNSIPTVAWLLADEAVKCDCLQQVQRLLPYDTASQLETRFENMMAAIEKSQHCGCLDAVFNFRDKHLAHSLNNTRREINSESASIPNPLYGQVSELLDKSVSIASELYIFTQGGSFDFQASSRNYEKQASEFWCNWKYLPPTNDTN